MVGSILSLLSAVVVVYTILCFIDIIMSWIPGAKFTQFGKFISRICDPYLNLFSKGGWLRIGNIDFSPIISIGLLSLLSSILSGITATGRIYFGGILATIVSMIWNVCSSLLVLLFLLVLIRWIVLLANHGQTAYGSAWNQVDMLINKFSYKIAGTFSKKPISYQNSLLITWITFLVLLIAGNILFNIFLVDLCYRIPF